jgi:hypothetical protein
MNGFDPYSNPPNLFWEIIVFINERWWLALLVVLVIGAACFAVYKLYNGHLEVKYGFRLINKPGTIALGVACVYAVLMWFPWITKSWGWFSMIGADEAELSFEGMVVRAWVIASPILLVYLINALVKMKSVIHAFFATVFLAALIPVYMYLVQFIVGLILLFFTTRMVINEAGKSVQSGSSLGYVCPKCGKILASQHTSCC